VNKYIRWSLLVVLVVNWLLIYQYSKEIFAWMNQLVLVFHDTGLGKIYLKTFGSIGFSVEKPDWLTKMIYTLVYIPNYLLIVGLYFYNKTTVKQMLVVVGVVFAGAVIFNVLGRVADKPNMVLMARNTMDLLVSPFMLVFLLPALKLAQNFETTSQKSA
jgi:hypothetical protein